jgi:hypothetical protein
MADEEVYIGKFPSGGRHVKSGKIDWESPGWREIKNQQMPPPETWPLPIYAGERMQRFERLPPAFIAAAFLACRPLADVFRHFNLGSDCVVPVQLYRFAKVTPETPEIEAVDADYCYVGISQQKQCFLPTESSQVRPYRYDSGPNPRWSALDIKDNDIAVSAAALEGADLWYDPILPEELFLKGHVMKALKKAGYGRVYRYIKCRVLPLQ